MTFSLLLLIFAAIAFFCAAIGFPSTGRVNLVAVGLLLWVIAVMIGPVQIS